MACAHGASVRWARAQFARHRWQIVLAAVVQASSRSITTSSNSSLIVYTSTIILHLFVDVFVGFRAANFRNQSLLTKYRLSNCAINNAYRQFSSSILC